MLHLLRKSGGVTKWCTSLPAKELVPRAPITKRSTGLHVRSCRVIFVIQNNQFAISVHISEQHAGGVEDISSGYQGLEIETVDGLDYLESHAAMTKAVAASAQREKVLP